MSDWYKTELLDNYSYRERVEAGLKWILLPRVKKYLQTPTPEGKQELEEIIEKIEEIQDKADNDIDW